MARLQKFIFQASPRLMLVKSYSTNNIEGEPSKWLLSTLPLAGGLLFGWILGTRSAKKELDAFVEAKLCNSHGLKLPVQAQQTGVVHLKQFLSEQEIVEIQAFTKLMQERQLVGRKDRSSKSEHQEFGFWGTTYIHTDGIFRQNFSSLHSKFRKAFFEVDAGNWNLLTGREASRLNFRTVEIHEYGSTGKLTTDKHYDAGSLITLDILLSEPETDFEGGELVMPEADGTSTVVEWKKGDAVLFVSHKYHNVLAVTFGRRVTMVVEIWDGPERTCAHRCLAPGPCDYTLSMSQDHAVAREQGQADVG